MPQVLSFRKFLKQNSNTPFPEWVTANLLTQNFDATQNVLKHHWTPVSLEVILFELLHVVSSASLQ